MEATQVKTQQAAQAPQGQKKGPAFRLPKKKKKWIVRGAVLLAVLAAVYWFFLRPGGNAGAAGQGAYTPAQAQRQDLTVSVSGTGTLEPLESYKVGALVSGDILEAPFEAGDWIEKGDLLYRIDAGDAETAVQQAQLSVRQAQLSYDELAQGLRPAASGAGVVQKLHVQKGDLVSPGGAIADITDTSTMTLTLPFQSADAQKLSPGQSAQVSIAGTGEVLTGSVESVSSADLVGTGGALVRQVKIRVSNPGALTESTTATATVGDAACAGSGNFEANSRQTVVAQASGEVTELHVTAGSRVSAGAVLATLGGTAARTALENAAISLENAQLSLQRSQTALDGYTITAPIAGTVIEKNFKAGDKVDSMDSGSLAVLYDLSSMQIKMNVNELDIGKVREGQEVEITSAALPGQVFRGVVERVSINGTTTSGFTTYPVTIRLDEYGELNPGMNVSADIIVERAEKALCVPIAAVNSDGTVFVPGEGAMSPDGTAVADPSKIESRPVTLGRGDDAYVEITGGLEEGDTILILGQAGMGPAASAMMAGG